MIEIKSLTKKYGKKEAVKETSLQLETCTYGLAGPNGAGKTTLIRLLAGVLKPDQGEILFEKKQENIGYLPQKFGCFPDLTVYEQMKYFACLKGIDKRQHKNEIMKALETVHLSEKQGVKCKKLSGGMVRRLGIAQALLGNPQFLLFDEPIVGLDPEERNHFNHIIRSLEGKMTILLSTHMIEEIKYLCSQLIVMDFGKILKAAEVGQIAALAKGRVYEIPEEELKEIKQPFYLQRSVKQNGASFARVLILGENGGMEKYHACEAEIEDGYLFLIKGKERNSE